jgi:hypothetical protein
VLAVIVGVAVVGGSSPPGPDAGQAIARQESAAPSVTPPVAYVPRPSPWAVPSPTVDPASFEGAGALAATTSVIPPPRWLAGRPAVAVIGVVALPVGRLNWRTDRDAK